MSLSFPLTLPSTPGNQAITWLDHGNVGVAVSPFTGQRQTYPWPFQILTAQIDLPPMREIDTGPWIAAFLGLNGPAGTFYLGDSVRKTPRGTIAGTVTVDSGAVAGSTTLPITGGTGAFALGDWLQVFTTTASRLHRVIKVNAGSVDVFPVLRTAYAAGSPITYNNPKGIFCLAQRVPWAFDARKIAQGVSFSAMEVLT